MNITEPRFLFRTPHLSDDGLPNYVVVTMPEVLEAGHPADAESEQELDYVGPLAQVVIGIEDGHVVIYDEDGEPTNTQRPPEHFGLSEADLQSL